ncbi:hypothetical protein [Phaeobacter inhibens]|uniref:hypothetical protein n=1 Tax=Phaeobacter inhibens TaxID=221822 RepID=UPI000C9B581E|nr:hypothetical protein [Phaeobacter inhibens]AUQ71031.1 putative phage tail tape measure protein [Phaeobacter inhibens]
MSAVIGALRGLLSLDSAAFESGAKRSKAVMGGLERRMVKMADGFEKHGRRMSLGFSLPLAGAAAVAVKSSLKIVDSQAKMAQSLDTTVKSVQVLDRAADLAGVSIGEVQQGSIQLTKRLSQAAGGTGAATKALERLHLRASDLQALPLDERIAAIQDAMQDYVPAAERAAVASDLFGSRAGVIFSRIDSATLRTAADDVERFGVSVSEVDADQIEVANDAISRLGVVGRGVANQLTVGLAPSLEFISDKTADAAEWFSGLSDQTKQFVAGGLALTATLGPVALGLGMVLKFAAPIAGALVAVASPVGLVVAGFTALAVAGAALGGSSNDAVAFAEAHEIAMDNVTIAMGDQISATVRLADALREGGPVTLAAIEAKMAEAEASRAVTAELVRQRQEKELEVLGYYDLLEAIGRYQNSLTAMRTPGDDLEQMPLKMRAAYEEAEAGLVALLAEQQRLLEGVRSQNQLTAEEAAHLQLIEANLAELQRRWNELNGIVSENVNLTDRGAVAADNLALGLGGAVGQAAALKGYLSGLPGALAGARADIAGLEAGISVLKGGGSKLAADVAKYRAELVATLPPLEKMHDGQRRNVEEGIANQVNLYEQQRRLQDQYQKQITTLGKVKSAAGSASKSALPGLVQEIAHRRKLVTLTGEQRRKYEALHAVQGRLGRDAASLSKDQINGLADQLIAVEDQEEALQRVTSMQEQWSEQITRTAFEGGSLSDTIKGMLKDIAYQFAHSKIVLPVVASVTNVLGLGGLIGGGGGGATAGGGGGNQVGGLLGLGGLGGSLVSGFGLGASTLFGGGLGAYTGLLGAQGAAALTGSLTSIAGFAGALGPIAIGIAVLAKGLSREYDGRAVRGSLGPDGFDGFEFDFWDGKFLRGDKQVNYDTRPEIQAMLDDGAEAVRTNVEKMAAAMGLGADAIKDFTADGFTIWLTGPNAGNQEQIAKAFEEQLTKLGDGMADLVLETEDYAKAGEGSYETLARLGGSLITANEGFDLINQTLLTGSLEAANSASLLMDAFGGVEQFTTGLGSYFELMFTDVEKQAKRQEYAQKALDEAAGELNLTLPTTHEAFRNLVGGLDRTTEEGRTAYVTLIGLADEFAIVHGNAQEAADALEGAGDSLSQLEAEAQKLKEQDLRDAFDALSASIDEAVKRLEGRLDVVGDRLKLRFKRLQISVDAERDEFRTRHDGLMDTLSGRLSSLEDAAAASSRLFETLDDAAKSRRSVDAGAAVMARRNALAYVMDGGSDPNQLSNALGVLGEDNSGTFSTAEDYLADFYRTSNIIARRADGAEVTMSADQMAVDALERQIELEKSQFDAEMARLDQILADGRQALEMATGEYIAAIKVENAVSQLNHTAERHALMSERIEGRVAELETIRTSMQELVASTIDPGVGLPGVVQGVHNVVSAVHSLSSDMSTMVSGISQAVAAQLNSFAASQANSLQSVQNQIRNLAQAQAAAAAPNQNKKLEQEMQGVKTVLEGFLGPISDATGKTAQSIRRMEFGDVKLEGGT